MIIWLPFCWKNGGSNFVRKINPSGLKDKMESYGAENVLFHIPTSLYVDVMQDFIWRSR